MSQEGENAARKGVTWLPRLGVALSRVGPGSPGWGPALQGGKRLPRLGLALFRVEKARILE